MTTSKEESSNDLSQKLRAYVPWIFSAIILIGYAYFISQLINKTSTTDKEWVKLTYVFSSVEAIVFTAVGFIFGREVNRTRAINAEKKEEKAKKDKKELAKDVLNKLPKPPIAPGSNAPNIANTQASNGNMSIQVNEINRLRTKAKKYLNE